MVLLCFINKVTSGSATMVDSNGPILTVLNKRRQSIGRMVSVDVNIDHYSCLC